ncbi:MAG: Ig-like domain-containing protein [Pseudomonadota bacterium]
MTVFANPYLDAQSVVFDDPELASSGGFLGTVPAATLGLAADSPALVAGGLSEAAPTANLQLVGGFAGFAPGATGLLAQSSDPDGDPLSWEIVAYPQHGTLAVNVDGTWDYTPGLGFFGTDSFQWRVSAGGEYSDTQTEMLFIQGDPLSVPVADLSLQSDAPELTESFSDVVPSATLSIQSDAASLSYGFVNVVPMASLATESDSPSLAGGPMGVPTADLTLVSVSPQLLAGFSDAVPSAVLTMESLAPLLIAEVVTGPVPITSPGLRSLTKTRGFREL